MKTIVETKTKEVMKTNVEKLIEKYFKNAEKHLFEVKHVWDKEYKETYYKVIPVDSKRYITVTIAGDKTDVSVKDIDWVTTKNHLGMMKNEVFPQYKKHRSVKRIKELQDKFDKIKEFVKSNSKLGADELKSEIEKILN